MAIAGGIEFDCVSFRKEFVIELIDLRRQYQEEYLKWAGEKLAAARKEFGRYDSKCTLSLTQRMHLHRRGSSPGLYCVSSYDSICLNSMLFSPVVCKCLALIGATSIPSARIV